MGLTDSMEEAYREAREAVTVWLRDTAPKVAEEWGRDTSKWAEEVRDDMVDAYKRAMSERVAGSLEEAEAEHKRFIQKVPFKYRFYFLAFSTGLVFVASRGITPRLFQTAFVGGVGLFLFTPELSPFNRRK